LSSEQKQNKKEKENRSLGLEIEYPITTARRALKTTPLCTNAMKKNTVKICQNMSIRRKP